MDMELGVDKKMPILKKKRMSTGISDFDIMMEGGYINPANIILIGPSGMEKAAFAYHFAAAAASDENAFIVCGSTSPDDIISKAAHMGLDLNKDNIRFIDCYSTTLGRGKAQGTEKITVVDGPSALNDLSLALNEAIRASAGKRIRIVFDTLSTFVLYNSKDSIRKFLGVVEGRLKNAGASSLYLVDEGVHEKQLLGLIEQGVDRKYTVVDRGGKFFLMMPKINVDIGFRLGPTGITII
jgi:KaiC/GvpD/RAD55 family RecA-like ATPase